MSSRRIFLWLTLALVAFISIVLRLADAPALILWLSAMAVTLGTMCGGTFIAACCACLLFLNQSPPSMSDFTKSFLKFNLRKRKSGDEWIVAANPVHSSRLILGDDGELIEIANEGQHDYSAL